MKIELLCQVMKLVTFEQDEIAVTQGDEGDAFYGLWRLHGVHRL